MEVFTQTYVFAGGVLLGGCFPFMLELPKRGWEVLVLVVLA